MEEGVERGGFAGTGGARDEQDAVGAVDGAVDHLVVALAHAEVAEANDAAALLEEAERNAFAVGSGAGGDADVDVLAVRAYADAAVHGQALLRDVQVRHDLDARNDRGLHALELRWEIDLVEEAVDAVADAQLGLHRLEMDVGRALLVGLRDDLVHEADDRRLLTHRAQVDLGDVGVGIDLHPSVLEHLLEGVRADAVVLAGCLADILAGAKREADRAIDGEAQAVGHPRVEGVVRRDREHAVSVCHRHDRILEGGARGKALDERRVGLGARQLRVGKAEQRREPAQEVLLADAVRLADKIDYARAFVVRGGERLLDLALREEARAL